MHQLDIRRPMAREALNLRYYLQSLLAEARRCALISDAEIASVQAGMQALLLRQATAWLRGKSSSVPAKAAQEILASAAFVIGLRLKACSTPEAALEALKCETPTALFDSGLELINRRLTHARLLQRRIEARLFETPNHFYRGTIVDGVNGFFKLYKPQFAAHEIHITADYPPCLGRPELDGVEFIEHYLRRIEAENAFLACFDAVSFLLILAKSTILFPIFEAYMRFPPVNTGQIKLASIVVRLSSISGKANVLVLISESRPLIILSPGSNCDIIFCAGSVRSFIGILASTSFERCV